MKLSELALVLETALRLASHRYGHELLPEEVADWAHRFEGEKPQMLEWAFREYDGIPAEIGKKFFPKPSDILQLIRMKRQSSDPTPGIRCAKCKDLSGFVYVQVEGEKYPRVKRCDHT